MYELVVLQKSQNVMKYQIERQFVESSFQNSFDIIKPLFKRRSRNVYKCTN